MRLLIIEDDADISKALKTVFEKNNYCADIADNGPDGISFGLSGNYDGIILDIMLPGCDGYEVLKKLRDKQITVPVLMLTARSEVSDKVAGLDAGADDYLAKPFSVSELLARVRAMLRRRSDYQPDIIKINNVVLNKGTLELEFNNKKTRLVAREYQVLEMMAENIGNIISTETMMEHIWGWDTDVEVSIVWVTVSNIRKKLVAINAPLSIRSVRGIGYALEMII